MTANPPIHPTHAGAEGDPFLHKLIKDRCADGLAEAGVVFRIRLTTVANSDGSQPVEGDADLLAIHPALATDSALPSWLEVAAHAASARVQSGAHELGATPINAASDSDPSAVFQWVVAAPLRFGVGEAPSAVAVFLVSASRETIGDTMTALSPVITEFETHERRLSAEPASPIDRVNDAVAPLLAANAHNRFFAAAVAVCNEIENITAASRVSIGFLRGRDIRLSAISHSEKIVRSMRLVRDIEGAMEEAIDQDREVVTPAPIDSPAVDRAANELSRKHGPASVGVLPLRIGGDPVGALCIERAADRPLSPSEVESIRLACELLTPRLHDLSEHDRWIGARAVASVRRSAATWLGPTHTWAKLLAIAGFAFLIFLIVAKGPHRVAAPFAIETIEQRVAPAPFDGYLESRVATVGDRVSAGDTLATLDSSSLLLERAEAFARMQGFASEADRARGAGNTAEALIAEASAKELQATVDLLDWRIERAVIRSPIDGVVVQGDLDALIGAPIRAGDTLFVIAPIDALQAELRVDSSRIADVRVDAGGTLATTADPSAKVHFVVTSIHPIALDEEAGGGFRVIAELSGSPDWLRPGMEGVAKIDAGRKRYAWLWSHRLVDWVRMRLWL